MQHKQLQCNILKFIQPTSKLNAKCAASYKNTIIILLQYYRPFSIYHLLQDEVVSLMPNHNHKG